MDIYNKFLNPSNEYTTVPFWFWNDKLSYEELTRQLELMAEQKIHQCVIHARNGLITPYLSEEWFNCINYVINEGKRLGIKFYIYDENNWPSGYAGGKVIEENPDYCGKHIKMREYSELETADVSDTLYTVAVFYKNKNGSWEKGDDINKPVCRRVFTEHYTHWKVAYGQEDYIDPLNADATKSFMKYTHNEYLKRYANEFGNTILGFFSDEAGFYNNLKLPWSDRTDDGTLVWNKNLPKYFYSKNGYDIIDYLNSLFVFDEEVSPKVRRDFFETVSLMYRENFLRPQRDFCEKYNMKFIGHLHYEDYLHLQIATQGNFFGALSELSYAGCDRIEYSPGAFTERLTSSVAHCYNKERVLSESFAQGGWDFSMQDLRYWADYQMVRGVNLFVVHAFFYSVEDFRYNDAPPSYFFQSPVYSQYHYFSEYAMRMCQLLSEGERKCDLAVYYPTAAAQVLFDADNQERVRSLDRDIQCLVSGLEKARYDFCLIDDNAISTMEDRNFKGLAVLSNWLELETLKSIYMAAKTGMPVVFLKHIPKCIECDFSENFNQILDGLLELKNVTFVDEYNFYCKYNYDFRVQCLQEFMSFSNVIKPLVELSSQEYNVKCTVRQFGDTTIYFVVNESMAEVKTDAVFFENRVPVIWNALDGSKTACEYETDNEKTIVKLDLKPYSSCLYVFGSEDCRLKNEKPTDSIALKGDWKISVLDKKYISQVQMLSDVFVDEIFYEYELTLAKKPKFAVFNIAKLNNTCRIFVNDSNSGEILWQPYKIKTDLLKEGKNIIRFQVYTTRAAMDNKGEKAYGIEGPVTVDLYY